MFSVLAVVAARGYQQQEMQPSLTNAATNRQEGSVTTGEETDDDGGEANSWSGVSNCAPPAD
jgi:hypothetical protein